MADQIMPGPPAKKKGSSITVGGQKGKVGPDGQFVPDEISSGYTHTQGLKEKAAKQALGVAQAAEAGVGSLEAAQQAGMRAIQGQAAEGLAAGQAAAGRFGGSAYGGALQAGKEAGLAQAEFGYGAEGALSDAKMKAAQAALEATEYQRELGTEKEDRAAMMADLDTRIAEKIAPHDKWYGFENVDAAAAAIRELKATVDDPEMVAYIEEKARQVETGEWDI